MLAVQAESSNNNNNGRPKHRKGPKRTEKDRKGPKRTEKDRKGTEKDRKGTEKDRKGRTSLLFTEKEAKRRRKVGDRQQNSRQGSIWGK